MSVRIENDDCLAAIPRLVAEGIIVDAVVTDPPYHLTATQSRFGKAGSAPAKHGRDGAMARLSGGFMGQQWDGGDVAFRPETWAAVATIMRPGAFLIAFGGTRTYHRLACAIEDGGFVIQDMIAWMYGSGFPKRRDALKPALEPCCLAYKPAGKRTMQIDECRTEGREQEQEQEQGSYDGSNVQVAGTRVGGKIYSVSLGRWPANVVHDGSDEVLAAFPDSAGQLAVVRGTEPSPAMGENGIYGHMSRDSKHQAIPRGDSGSAARFFYSPKADLDDRWHSRHPTVKPVDLISWLVKLVTPPGGLFLDPFAGSGTAGAAAVLTGRRAILIEREPTYVADIEERMAALRSEATRPAPRPRRHRDPGDLLSIVGEE